MHRSRIGIFLLDHPADVYERAAAFWAAATGRTPVPDDEAQYASLGSLGAVRLEHQRTGVGTPPRIHLDVETDDVEAEVARLVDLGATVVDEPDGFVVLHDPAGLVFCVVAVQTGADFDAHAVFWG